MGDRVAVVGAGSWGTALAVHLGRLGSEVRLWGRRRESLISRGLRGERATPQGTPAAENLRVTSDLPEACAGAVAAVIACPSHAVREVCGLVASLLEPSCVVISTAKGIERDTGDLMTSVMQSALGGEFGRLGALSGPTFAREVALGLPTAATAAAASLETAETIQTLFNGAFFRVYTSTDVVGVQVGGAVKNVIALAAGVSDGMGLGANARAALMTRGLAEVSRLAAAIGADPRTMAGLSGMGDLVLTCTGDLSRNRTVGLRLGRGELLADIVASMDEVAEGVHNTRSVYDLAHRLGVEMPITDQMFLVVEKGKDPQSALVDLMSRRARPELDDASAECSE
jgi:glycerol-3-phosphate dehydrogenase (NAD(P)+)